jgi:hypothetical protein
MQAAVERVEGMVGDHKQIEEEERETRKAY